jgi:hypothetical protein
MMNLTFHDKKSLIQTNAENGLQMLLKYCSNTKTYNFQEIKVILKQILTILNFGALKAYPYLKIWIISTLIIF